MLAKGRCSYRSHPTGWMRDRCAFGQSVAHPSPMADVGTRGAPALMGPIPSTYSTAEQRAAGWVLAKGAALSIPPHWLVAGLTHLRVKSHVTPLPTDQYGRKRQYGSELEQGAESRWLGAG